MKISVIIKEPGRRPRHVWIENSLKNLQKTVGGYIEAVTLGKDLVVICNEEGRLRMMPYNCHICGVGFVGPIILCGVKGEEFYDIPITFEEAKRMFPQLWEVAYE